MLPTIGEHNEKSPPPDRIRGRRHRLQRFLRPGCCDPAEGRVAHAESARNRHPKPIETLTPEEARKQPTPADAVKKVLADMGKSTAPEPGVTVKDMMVPVDGGSVPVHIYTPEGKGPFPVMVYYHGGGFVIADTKVYDAAARAGQDGECDHGLGRLPPGARTQVPDRAERRLPRPMGLDHPACQGIQRRPDACRGRRRIAGGNLATVVSMMARDKKVADAGAPAAGLPGRRQRHEHARPTSATPTPSRSTSR
jgi:acetyl esterase